MINIETLRQLRIQQHWSQEELAAASGVSLRTVQRVESTGKCSSETMKALSAALNVVPDTLNNPRPSGKKSPILELFNPFTSVLTISFFLLLLALSILFIRNYQSAIEFNVVIEDEHGVFTDTIKISPPLSSSGFFELHNGYALEVDYMFGLTPRLKSQLYLINDKAKSVIHTSNRTGTVFHPAQYKVTLSDVTYISPYKESNMTGKG